MPPRPYQDNPFEPSSSRVDIDDYYGDIPVSVNSTLVYFYRLRSGSVKAIADVPSLQPAHRLSGGLYPTSNTSSNFASIPLAARNQHYSPSPLPAESTDNLAAAHTPHTFGAGYGMSTGSYADLRSKPGGYAPVKSNRKKWWIVCFPYFLRRRKLSEGKLKQGIGFF